MARFLKFVVERSLAGDGASLKEYLIGVEVFDRRPSYDPRVDPIVRVEARRLRAKLAEYYEHEGQSESIRIELPKGQYAPLFHFAHDETHGEATAAAELAQQNGAVADRLIALLPFSNLTPDSEGDYFSDGLTEELTHLLTRVPGLQVVAWNSAAQLKGRQADLAAVARQLSAELLVRGSVRRAGDRVRVMAQLIHGVQGSVLWSESYDGREEDIFAVQAEIATAITRALQLRIMETPRALAGSSPRAPSLRAYDLYLKGRYWWNTRTPAGLRRSLECFEQSTATDPNFPLAHAGVADALTILVDYGLAGPEALEPAEQAARRALDLAPELAEPYAALALLRSFEFRWEEAEDLYRRALLLSPNYATAHHWLGIDLLAVLGRFEEAEEELKIACRLDPLSAITREGLGMLYMFWSRWDDAERTYAEVARLDPANTKVMAALGRLHLQRGDLKRGCEALEQAAMRLPDLPVLMGALGQAYGLLGRREEALAVLRRLEHLAKSQSVPSVRFALVHLGLGEHQQALDWLERAVACCEPPRLSIGVHPVWDPVRADPRFRAIIERMGLAQAETWAESYRKAAQ